MAVCSNAVEPRDGRVVVLGELISDGRTSEVYRYGTDGAAKVLKPSTPQHWAQVEASFTAEVRKLGVPVPEVRGVIEIDGRSAVLFERIDGPSMWQRMVEHPHEVPQLTRELVDVHRAIHAAGVPAGLPSLVDRLHLKIAGADELSAAEKHDANKLLDGLPRGAALLHGDLHPGNVLLGRNGLAVIDWFDATVGHPHADVARTLLLLQPTGATDLRHLPGATEPLVRHVHDDYEAGSIDPDRELTTLHRWCRLRAAGRLAERTDADVSGLLARWRDRGSGVDHDAAK